MKVVHVITKCGMERLTPLGGSPDLRSWWGNTRLCGAIVGDTWCCHFYEISFAEIVDVNVEGVEEPAPDSLQAQSLNRFAGGLAAAIASGRFKPPSE